MSSDAYLANVSRHNLKTKCILINNEPNNISAKIPEFLRENSNVDLEEKVLENFGQIKDLLSKEIKNFPVGHFCLVVYIMGKFMKANSSENNQNGTQIVRTLAELFSDQIKPIGETPVFVLLKDKKGLKSADKNQCRLLYQKSNLNISLGTSSSALKRLLFQIINLDFPKAEEPLKMKILENPVKEYEISQSGENICLILNLHLDELDRLVKIEDNLEDARMLEDTFLKIGFQVISFKEFEFQKIIRFVSNYDFSSCNCFALCLITHYQNEYFYLNSKGRFKLEKIINLLNESLSEKPKIFLIHDPYKNLLTDKSSDSMDALDYLTTIPKHCLNIHSTSSSAQINDNQLFNFKNEASSFIRNLCNLLISKFETWDLLRILQTAAWTLGKSLKKHENVPSVLVNSTLERLVAMKNKFRIEKLIRNRFLSNLEIDDSIFARIKHGKCILISYSTEEQGYSNSPPTVTTKDLSKLSFLKETFESLKFDVHAIADNSILTWKSHDHSLIEASKQIEYYDCLIIFIFPNGNQEAIVERDSLLRYFSSKSLAHKPILFFVLDENKYRTAKHDSDSYVDCTKNQTFRHSNFLYYYSNDVTQSVNFLCEQFLTNSSKFDLNRLLTLAQEQIYQNNDEIISYFESTLTRSILFDNIRNDPLSNIGGINPTCQQNRKTRQSIFVNYRKQDSDNLEKTFKKLNFDTQTHEDLNVKETLNLMEMIFQSDYSSVNCFVLCYSTYRKENPKLPYRCDNAPICINDLIRCFALNRTLVGKPKIFIFDGIINGCMKESCSHNIQIDGMDHNPYDSSKWNYPDLFVFTCSYPGSHAWRHIENGSFFIQELCHSLEMYPKYDLATIASIVCKNVGQIKKFVVWKGDKKKIVKQIPFVHSTMTKSIQFTHD